MQKPEIWRIVFANLSPFKPDFTSSDWRSYIARYIVPEVKQESLRFFGNLDSQESQYPGLDYANSAHRLRLEQFPQHKELFRVFDMLGLKSSELYTLCKWHGTRKVKDEFERKKVIEISDTTWHCVRPHQPSQSSLIFFDTVHIRGGQRDSGMLDRNDVIDQEIADNTEDEGNTSEDESEDGLRQSVGIELNERLMASAEANAEARARGEQVTTDADWEQWLKEVAERNFGPGIDRSGLRPSTPGSPHAQRVSSRRRLDTSTVASNFAHERPHNTHHHAALAVLPTVLNISDIELPASGLPSIVGGQ